MSAANQLTSTQKVEILEKFGIVSDISACSRSGSEQENHNVKFALFGQSQPTFFVNPPRARIYDEILKQATEKFTDSIHWLTTQAYLGHLTEIEYSAKDKEITFSYQAARCYLRLRDAVEIYEAAKFIATINGAGVTEVHLVEDYSGVAVVVFREGRDYRFRIEDFRIVSSSFQRLLIQKLTTFQLDILIKLGIVIEPTRKVVGRDLHIEARVCTGLPFQRVFTREPGQFDFSFYAEVELIIVDFLMSYLRDRQLAEALMPWIHKGDLVPIKFDNNKERMEFSFLYHGSEFCVSALHRLHLGTRDVCYRTALEIMKKRSVYEIKKVTMTELKTKPTTTRITIDRLDQSHVVVSSPHALDHPATLTKMIETFEGEASLILEPFENLVKLRVISGYRAKASEGLITIEHIYPAYKLKDVGHRKEGETSKDFQDRVCLITQKIILNKYSPEIRSFVLGLLALDEVPTFELKTSNHVEFGHRGIRFEIVWTRFSPENHYKTVFELISKLAASALAASYTGIKLTELYGQDGTVVDLYRGETRTSFTVTYPIETSETIELIVGRITDGPSSPQETPPQETVPNFDLVKLGVLIDYRTELSEQQTLLTGSYKFLERLDTGNYLALRRKKDESVEQLRERAQTEARNMIMTSQMRYISRIKEILELVPVDKIPKMKFYDSSVRFTYNGLDFVIKLLVVSERDHNYAMYGAILNAFKINAEAGIKSGMTKISMTEIDSEYTRVEFYFGSERSVYRRFLSDKNILGYTCSKPADTPSVDPKPDPKSTEVSSSSSSDPEITIIKLSPPSKPQARLFFQASPDLVEGFYRVIEPTTAIPRLGLGGIWVLEGTDVRATRVIDLPPKHPYPWVVAGYKFNEFDKGSSRYVMVVRSGKAGLPTTIYREALSRMSYF